MAGKCNPVLTPPVDSRPAPRAASAAEPNPNFELPRKEGPADETPVFPVLRRLHPPVVCRAGAATFSAGNPRIKSQEPSQASRSLGSLVHAGHDQGPPDSPG